MSIYLVDPELVMVCAACGTWLRCDGKCRSCGLQMPGTRLLPVSRISYPPRSEESTGGIL